MFFDYFFLKFIIISIPLFYRHFIRIFLRPLYDIANVFKSLGLIKKITLNSKKPAFEFIGESGLISFLDENAPVSNTNTSEKPQKSKIKRILTIIVRNYFFLNL